MDSFEEGHHARTRRPGASLCEILGALMMHHGDLFMQQVMPQLLVVLNTFLSQRDPLCAGLGGAGVLRPW